MLFLPNLIATCKLLILHALSSYIFFLNPVHELSLYSLLKYHCKTFSETTIKKRIQKTLI